MKKNLKRIISLIAATVTMTGVMVGCGSQENGSASKKTITYSIWDKVQEPGMRAIADAFEAKNPDIDVNIEITPWDQYWTKMEAAATGGALPDVFWMHPSQINKYAESSVLMDLTDVVNKSEIIDLSKFPSDLVKLYSPNEKNYAIPKDFDTIGLWYNKTLFDEAGVEYPNENWDWNTLLEASKKLTNKDTGVYGIAAHLNNHDGYYNFIYQNDGQVLTDNNSKSGYSMPETKEALQFYVDLSLKEGVSPTQEQFAENSPATLFQSGKVAMSLFGSWMVGEFSANEYVLNNCDVAVLPKQKQQSSVYNGLGNAVSAKTKNPEEASKFVEFLGSEEANLIQAEKGSAISAYEGTADKWVESVPEFNIQAYIDMLDYSVIKPSTKNTAKWEQVENEVLRKAFAGEITVDEASAQLTTKIDELLKEEQ